MREVTPQTLKEVTTAKQLALVEFWAPWCGPCRMLEPVLTRLEKEFDGQVSFGRLNVDGNQDFALENKIQSIPTMFLYVDGKPKEKITGYRELEPFRKYLKQKIGQYLD